MAVLDFVDSEVERWKSKRVEEERGETMKQNMASAMKGKHA